MLCIRSLFVLLTFLQILSDSRSVVHIPIKLYVRVQYNAQKLLFVYDTIVVKTSTEPTWCGFTLLQCVFDWVWCFQRALDIDQCKPV